MLQLDPAKRITATEALKHAYFHSDPLPCKPSEIPSFSGDFHEYTVRKDFQARHNDNNTGNGRHHQNYSNENSRMRQRSRGEHSANHNQSYIPKPNDKVAYNKGPSFERNNKYNDGQPSNQLSGTKRPYNAVRQKQYDPKPKFNDGLLEQQSKPSPSLEASGGMAAPTVQKSEENQKKELDPRSFKEMIKNHITKDIQKKRELKEESKEQGRGINE